MSFRINTNITAMNAYKNSLANDASLSDSLGKLSSGLGIRSAADDASGMTIADSLRSQANALGQAIKNANDAKGVVETADNAMNEQLTIVDTIKTKATQAAQDGQSTSSRAAIQRDISRLLEELDNIANTTSFNGQVLLNGNFSNKNFQIGAYSNETVQVSIGATNSNKIGLTRFETSANVAFSGVAFNRSALGSTAAMTNASAVNVYTLTLNNLDGYPNGYSYETIKGDRFLQDGLKAVAEQVNAVSDLTGVKASVNNSIVLENSVKTGTIKELVINDIRIGTVDVVDGDRNAVLTNAINAVKEQTGVTATISQGKLTLTATDGRSIRVQALSGGVTNMGFHSNSGVNFTGGVSTIEGMQGKNKGGLVQMGRITFIRQDARDIDMTLSVTGATSVVSVSSRQTTTGLLYAIGARSAAGAAAITSHMSQKSISLADLNTGIMTKDIADALGYFATGEEKAEQLSGVTTYAGAQAMIDVAEAAQKLLDSIRSDLGSVTNQLVATISNITTTQVNVKAAESQIRDVDFAQEASNFNKFNILAQSGSYAMSQANTVQQNVLRLLQ